MNADVNLYKNYLNGDNSALNELVALYGDGLVRFAYCFVKDSAAAEDVMAETFATFIVKRKKAENMTSVKAYLYKIARNKAIDYLRYNKRFVPLEDFDNVLCSENVEESVSRNDLRLQIYAGLQQLQPQYRDVLTLVYLENFSIAEVTVIIGKTFKQTYNLLSRAKSALKNLLKTSID